jgi:Holliday junction resolvase RusA-like endonuclease
MTRTGRAYTPKGTRDYERDLRILARDVMRTREPFSGPLTVEVTAYMPAPESWPNWKSERVSEHGQKISHTVKPDIDNLAKVIDGLNGVVWVDDSQITDLHVYKRYSRQPRLIVEVAHDTVAVHSKTKTRAKIKAG